MKYKAYKILNFLTIDEKTYMVLDEVNARIAIGKSPKGKDFIKEVQYNEMIAYAIPLGYIIGGNPYENYRLVPTKIVTNNENSIDLNKTDYTFKLKFNK